MHRILAIDPGITTGVVIALIPADGPVLLSIDEARMDHLDYWDLLEKIDPHFIVCESFEYRNRARDNLELYSCELIGITKLYEQTPGMLTQLKMQPASMGKSVSDAMLKKQNLYVRGNPHGRDALRHFVYWFQNGQGFQFNTKLGRPIEIKDPKEILELLQSLA